MSYWFISFILTLVFGVGFCLGALFHSILDVGISASNPKPEPGKRDPYSIPFDEPFTFEEFMLVCTNGGMDLSNMTPEQVIQLWKRHNDRRTGVLREKVRTGNERLLEQAKEMLKNGVE
jgi:hypothetical protein